MNGSIVTANAPIQRAPAGPSHVTVRKVDVEDEPERQGVSLANITIDPKSLTSAWGFADTARMLRLGLAIIATLRSALRTREHLVLENLALRHQLELLTRGDRRPRFRPVDRLLWVGLRRYWAAWRDALVLVQPATVIRWHREGLRRSWRRRSQPRPCAPQK